MRLLAGDSEKEASRHLRLSQHTVHDYVKQLYKRLGVSSRAELMAKWVRVGSGKSRADGRAESRIEVEKRHLDFR